MTNKRYQQINETSMQVQEPVVEYQRTKPVAYDQKLNAAQIQFLQMLRFVETEEELNELKQIVSDFYIKKLQEEADRLWDKGILGDFLLNEHLRTSYNY